jgi:hypothetical protein
MVAKNRSQELSKRRTTRLRRRYQDPVTDEVAEESTDVDFDPRQLQGFKLFEALGPILEALHGVGAERDRAGNRDLHYDYYVSLILFFFFNPVLTSMRSIQQASTLKKVQEKLGINRTSTGSLSEAQSVFDADCLKPIISELAKRVNPLQDRRGAQALANLTAVDGSLFRALPRMAWALWNYEDKKAVRLHLHFEVMSGAPFAAEITHGKHCEKKVLHTMIEPGRFYVMDRGYEQFHLYQQINDKGSYFVTAVRGQMTWKVIEPRELTSADQEAGVTFDAVVELGAEKAKGVLTRPYRVVMISYGNDEKTGEPKLMPLVTNELDLPAELIALAYHYRWQIELFFRWIKCILGCQHLVHEKQNGVKLQLYIALIASLLIMLWAGRKPTKRTFEMVCLYLQGWADLEELTAHIQKLKALEEKS